MGHFLSFYLPPKNLKNHFEREKEISGDTIILHVYTKNHIFFYHFGPFFPFNFLNRPENQNFEKMKASGDVIILYLYTKSHNHMMYASWDMECNRHNFLSFWAIFYPFTPLFIPKIKFGKKVKKPLEILSFYTCVA